MRGKLTARLIGRPLASVTDSAALLARLPELVPQAADRSDVLSMPHHCSVSNSNWPAAAAQAGLTYVDPQWAPDRILALYGRAKLVVTEAMHGAIVADTLRIPWIPIIISPQLSVFEWRDWLSSLDMPYRPIAVPASARLEQIQYSRITRITEASGGSVAHVGAAEQADEALIDDFGRRHANDPGAIAPPSAPGAIATLVKRIVPLFDGARIADSAKVLREVAAGESYLSAEFVFADRLDGLEHAVQKLIADVLAA